MFEWLLSDQMVGNMLYVNSLLLMGGIYALMCLGLNVQWGFTGLFNAGIAGFAAVGAYTYAILTTFASGMHIGGYELPIWVGMLAAMIASGIIALAIGAICIRLRADYLAIATIGIAEIIKLILKNETAITNGPRGIAKVPRSWEHLGDARVAEKLPWRLFGEPSAYEGFFREWYPLLFMLTVVGCVLLVYLALEIARTSPWGRVMTAIRENEAAARAAGKNVTRLRIESFVVGAVIIGLAGAFYAQQLRFIEPTNAFDPTKLTFLVWVMLIMGGSGNNRGAVLGGLMLWVIWSGSELFIRFGASLVGEILPDLSASVLVTKASFLRLFLIGLILQLVLQRFPRGIMPEVRPAALGEKTNEVRD